MTPSNRHRWALASMLVMLSVASGACCKRGAAPQPPVIRYLPTPPTACLTHAPPNRPTLPADDEPIATAMILDYAWALDRWARAAWAVCQ